MYQFNLSVDSKFNSWLFAIEKVFMIKIRSISGVIATKTNLNRVIMSIACNDDRREEAEEIIKCTIVDMYLTVCKHNYLSQEIKLPLLSVDAKKILLHTLVAFDREAEAEIIENELQLKDSLALDGFFNFRLQELKNRWNEISSMATSNSVLINSDENLDELLKFLMSAISPKINKISINAISNSDSYEVSGVYNNSIFEFHIISPIQLLLYLINVAPIEVILSGEFSDKKLYRRIVSIFDGKVATNN